MVFNRNMMKYDALASLGAAGIMDIDALAQWISKSFSENKAFNLKW